MPVVLALPSGSSPLALAGLLAPGGSQILFTLAIREAGASRTSVVVGTAPLVSVAIALVALHEPAKTPLLAGAVPIVAAGVALARERTRPGHLRAIGLAFGAGATVLFASRDNLVRWLATQGSARPAVAAAATSLWGVALTALLVRHEGIGRRIVAGAALVVAGGALIGAFR